MHLVYVKYSYKILINERFPQLLRKLALKCVSFLRRLRNQTSRANALLSLYYIFPLYSLTSNAMTTPVATISLVREVNWSGYIPVIITLAPTSLSSPTMPLPLHRMLSRLTYLHVGLRRDVRRLYKFAPATLSMGFRSRGESDDPFPDVVSRSEGDADAKKSGRGSDEDGIISGKDEKSLDPTEKKYPICWFEDEASGMALRWNLFSGVLYDLMKSRRNPGEAAAQLPWRIRVHFTSYPSHQILSFADDGVLQTIERTFKNSLKQALFLQHGSSKIAMGLSKASHQKLWYAVMESHYALYEEVNGDGMQASGSEDERVKGLHNVPVRVMVDGRAAIQRPCTAFRDNLKTTLGDILVEWLPNLFERLAPPRHKKISVASIRPESLSWTVQGITIPLSLPISDLWQSLCHPDHFLYVNVTTHSPWTTEIKYKTPRS